MIDLKAQSAMHRRPPTPVLCTSTNESRVDQQCCRQPKGVLSHAIREFQAARTEEQLVTVDEPFIAPLPFARPRCIQAILKLRLRATLDFWTFELPLQLSLVICFANTISWISK